MLKGINKINKPDRIVNVIVENIVKMIQNGTIQQGDRLPSEKDLAEAFGVGRSTIREALQALELSGFIITKKGVGRFLVKDKVDQEISNLEKWVEAAPYFQLLEAREHLEVLIVSLAVERATEEIITEMKETIQRMSLELHDIDLFFKTEFHFHQIIYEACGNEVLTQLMSTITEKIFKEHDKIRKSYVRNAKSAVVDAQGILDAFISIDVEKAKLVMRKHIEQIRLTYEEEELITE